MAVFDLVVELAQNVIYCKSTVKHSFSFTSFDSKVKSEIFSNMNNKPYNYTINLVGSV